MLSASEIFRSVLANDSPSIVYIISTAQVPLKFSIWTKCFNLAMVSIWQLLVSKIILFLIELIHFLRKNSGDFQYIRHAMFKCAPLIFLASCSPQPKFSYNVTQWPLFSIVWIQRTELLYRIFCIYILAYPFSICLYSRQLHYLSLSSCSNSIIYHCKGWQC